MTRLFWLLPAVALLACGAAPTARPEPELHAHAPVATPPPPHRLPGRPRPPPDDAPPPPGAVNPLAPHPYGAMVGSVSTSRWSLPRGIPGVASLSAVVCLEIDPSGALLAFGLTQPSGFTAFDDSVIAAVTREPGYPPAPPLPPNLANALCFRFHAKAP